MVEGPGDGKPLEVSSDRDRDRRERMRRYATFQAGGWSLVVVGLMFWCAWQVPRAPVLPLAASSRALPPFGLSRQPATGGSRDSRTVTDVPMCDGWRRPVPRRMCGFYADRTHILAILAVAVAA